MANEFICKKGLIVTGDVTISGTVGDLSIGGGVEFVSGGGLTYGEIYAYNVSGTITISSSGQVNKVQITAFDTDGLSNGNITPDNASDHITTGVDGHYMLTCSIACSTTGAGSGAKYGFAAYKNNGTTLLENCHSHRELAGGGGDAGSVSINGIINCTAADTVEIWVWNEDSTDDIVVDDITFSLTQIGTA